LPPLLLETFLGVKRWELATAAEDADLEATCARYASAYWSMHCAQAAWARSRRGNGCPAAGTAQAATSSSFASYVGMTLESKTEATNSIKASGGKSTTLAFRTWWFGRVDLSSRTRRRLMITGPTGCHRCVRFQQLALLPAI